MSTTRQRQLTLTGVWKSSYRYPSSSRGREFESHHYVRVYQTDEHIVFASIPGINTSRIVVKLYFEGSVGTGTWQEETDLYGYYRGAIYYGAIQMSLNDEHTHLEGIWAGFDREMAIQTGPWKLEYVGEETPEGD